MREKFDVLPVREADGRIIRYVRREAIEGHRSELDWVRIELSDIHPDEIVSAASPLLDLLDRFCHNRPRLFVLDRRGIEGIVTVFDLNQPAAHQFGFALSLVVEAALARAIEEACRHSPDELDAEVDEQIRLRIRRLSRDHKEIRSRAEA